MPLDFGLKPLWNAPVIYKKGLSKKQQIHGGVAAKADFPRSIPFPAGGM